MQALACVALCVDAVMVSVIRLRNTRTKYNFCFRIVGELKLIQLRVVRIENVLSTAPFLTTSHGGTFVLIVFIFMGMIQSLAVTSTMRNHYFDLHM